MRKFTFKEIKEFVSKQVFDEKIILNKDSSYPKISIVTPSYNQSEFLERTILSVLNQNYPNLEYIIIDGGSTDGSVEVIKKYEKYLSYWVSETDEGQSDALNKGFSKATGDIIGWQNSDDVYLSGAFCGAVEVFKKDPHIDIVFSNRLDVDEQDRIIGESRFTPFSLITYMYDGMSLSNQSTFWRRELFSKTEMIDKSLQVAMDYEFFLRAGVKGARFKHLPYYWGAIRRHKASKENTLWSSSMKRELDVINRRYGRITYLNFPLRMYSLMRRSLYYFLQGDWDYLFRGFKRRTGLFLKHLSHKYPDTGR